MFFTPKHISQAQNEKKSLNYPESSDWFKMHFRGMFFVQWQCRDH